MLFNDNYHETLTSYQKEITRDPAKKHLLYLLPSTITISRLTQAACKKNWLLWTTLFPRWRWGKLSWILASWQVVGKVTMHVALEIIWMYVPQNIWGKSKWIYVTKFVLNFSILMFQADQRDVMSEPWMTCPYLGPVCGQICQGLVKQTPWKKENNFKSGGKLFRNKRPKL